ncbi:MAG: SHOCT domain-containing protein [Liquorilactobacillus hordei]|uniref:SHOCT domain-containing protein n=1 Tax=Liquorilactobacillus hordei TaxID=468911 RepID=UPI0039EAC901
MGLMYKIKESIKAEEEKAQEKIKIERENKKEQAALAKEFSKNEKKLNSYLKYNDSLKAFGINLLFGVPGKIIKYKDLSNFELQQDGETVTKGGLGRVIVFGVATGGLGAVVGGITGKKSSSSINTETKIKIVSKNETADVSYINFNQKKLKKNSNAYKQIAIDVDKTLAFLQKVVDEQSEEMNIEKAENISSVADEIKKFKELADSGIITQEEFETKKKQLLGL